MTIETEDDEYRSVLRNLMYLGANDWARSFQRLDFPHYTDKEFLARRKQTHLSERYREAWDKVWAEEWDRRTLVRPANGFDPATSDLLTPLP